MVNIFKEKSAAVKEVCEALFLVLSVDYLLLFGAETILPGFVMKVFNLNYLLLGLVILWLFLYFFDKKGENEKQFCRRTAGYAESGLLVFLFAVLAISLYRLSFVLIATYASLAAICFLILKKHR